jgi:hypothetical protein
MRCASTAPADHGLFHPPLNGLKACDAPAQLAVGTTGFEGLISKLFDRINIASGPYAVFAFCWRQQFPIEA